MTEQDQLNCNNDNMRMINDTLRFIVPMLYSSRRGLNDDFFFNEYLVGAFTSDFYRPEFDEGYTVLLAYKYDHSEKYLNFEKKLIESLQILDMYSYDEQDIVVYVVQIPENFFEDYDKIACQEFDEISPELKLNIWKMWSLNSKDNLAKIINNEVEYDGELFEEQILKVE